MTATRFVDKWIRKLAHAYSETYQAILAETTTLGYTQRNKVIRERLTHFHYHQAEQSFTPPALPTKKEMLIVPRHPALKWYAGLRQANPALYKTIEAHLHKIGAYNTQSPQKEREHIQLAYQFFVEQDGKIEAWNLGENITITSPTT